MKTSLRWYGPTMLAIARTSMAGSDMGTRNTVRPCCFRPARRGPRKEEAPLGHGRVRGPDLLARHPPAIAVADGGRPQRGQVRAGIRLAETLAPDHLAPRDGWQMLACCSGVPWRMITGPTQLTPMY